MDNSHAFKVVSKVVRAVARETGVKTNRMFLSTRGRPREALARQMVMWLLHQPPHDMNFTDIGTFLGRYRKTVSHGVELISFRRTHDLNLARQLRTLKEAATT